MGGHAFHHLYCPRIPPDIYTAVKAQTLPALRTIFSHVVVPTEMPEKEDYGDIDFLVSGPLFSPTSTNIDNFDWPGTVQAIKSVFNTTQGRRGFKNPECMYFAIRAPGYESEFWVQVDVKVCFKSYLFELQTFKLNYASNSKIIGSIVKPLGLTIDPEGLHIRIEEIEETNLPGSMVWIGKDPRDVLRITGLGRSIIDAGFKTKDEFYRYLASSWLFNPAHFAARLAEGKYFNRLGDRSPHWTYFIKEWVPKHYPGYEFATTDSYLSESDATNSDQQDVELQAWYKHTRAAVRDKVFTMFPHVAAEYYTKRAIHVKEQEEQRLRAIIMAAIPTGNNGWSDSLPQPHVVIKGTETEPKTPEIKPTALGELTPPSTPTAEILENELRLTIFMNPPNSSSYGLSQPWDVPLYVEPLPRTPEWPCMPIPPPENMAPDRKLLCLARWTLFDSVNGTPYLLPSPRDKDFEMHWAEAAHAGATDKMLVDWAKEMWWTVWIRQSHVNYVGMWKRRFANDDKRAAKKKLEEEARAEAETLAEATKDKMVSRLGKMNLSLGLIG